MDDSRLANLYDRLKQIIWVIKVMAPMKEDKVLDKSYRTGFCVSRDGLIMTKACGLEEGSTIWVRKLYGESDERFIDTVTVKKIDINFDVAVLKVEGSSENFDQGTLAANGNLFQGESILCLGNPREFLGSFLIGRNAFQCTEEDNLSYQISRHRFCEKYDSRAYSKTPDYRVMGHIYNKATFEKLNAISLYKGDTLDFEKKLYSATPIIQCYGFGFAEGCEGGPVFNIHGDVVGMITFETKGFQIAIHVTVLRSLLNDVKEEDNNMEKKQEEDQGVSKKPRTN